jgi:CHASE2 domain-containing sensor protein
MHNYINYRYDSLSDVNKKPFCANSFIELSKESFKVESIQAMVNGKIILLGHINKDSTTVIDKHFTPLNKEYIGRSLPDMDGIMIHANTLSMHLDKAYIVTMYPIAQWSLTFVLLFLNVTILIHFTKSKFVFKDIVLRLIQIIQTIIMFIFAIVIFHYFRVRIDLSIFLLPILSFVDLGKFMIEKLVPFILKENN